MQKFSLNASLQVLTSLLVNIQSALPQYFGKWQVFPVVSKHRTTFTVSVKKFFDPLTLRMKTQ